MLRYRSRSRIQKGQIDQYGEDVVFIVFLRTEYISCTCNLVDILRKKSPNFLKLSNKTFSICMFISVRLDLGYCKHEFTSRIWTALNVKNVGISLLSWRTKINETKNDKLIIVNQMRVTSWNIMRQKWTNSLSTKYYKPFEVHYSIHISRKFGYFGRTQMKKNRMRWKGKWFIHSL